MKRPQVPDAAIYDALDYVRKQLEERIHEKGRGIFISPHEALGIITEEFHEYLDAVHNDSPISRERELMDIIVPAIFEIISQWIRQQERDDDATDTNVRSTN